MIEGHCSLRVTTLSFYRDNLTFPKTIMANLGTTCNPDRSVAGAAEKDDSIVFFSFVRCLDAVPLASPRHEIILNRPPIAFTAEANASEAPASEGISRYLASISFKKRLAYTYPSSRYDSGSSHSSIRNFAPHG